MPTMMVIAGVAISEDDVLELVRRLHDGGFHDVALTLEEDADVEAHALNATIDDREAMLQVLDDPPTDALAQLRGVLRRDHAWFKSQGLV